MSLMDENDIPYVWTIFTEKDKSFYHPNVFCVENNLDIIKYVKSSHYLVQLSDDVERIWL